MSGKRTADDAELCNDDNAPTAPLCVDFARFDDDTDWAPVLRELARDECCLLCMLCPDVRQLVCAYAGEKPTRAVLAQSARLIEQLATERLYAVGGTCFQATESIRGLQPTDRALADALSAHGVVDHLFSQLKLAVNFNVNTIPRANAFADAIESLFCLSQLACAQYRRDVRRLFDVTVAVLSMPDARKADTGGLWLLLYRLCWRGSVEPTQQLLHLMSRDFFHENVDSVVNHVLCLMAEMMMWTGTLEITYAHFGVEIHYTLVERAQSPAFDYYHRTMLMRVFCRFVARNCTHFTPALADAVERLVVNTSAVCDCCASDPPNIRCAVRCLGSLSMLVDLHASCEFGCREVATRRSVIQWCCAQLGHIGGGSARPLWLLLGAAARRSEKRARQIDTEAVWTHAREAIDTETTPVRVLCEIFSLIVACLHWQLDSYELQQTIGAALMLVAHRRHPELVADAAQVEQMLCRMVRDLRRDLFNLSVDDNREKLSKFASGLREALCASTNAEQALRYVGEMADIARTAGADDR